MFIKWYSMNSIKKISGIRCNSNPNFTSILLVIPYKKHIFPMNISFYARITLNTAEYCENLGYSMIFFFIEYHLRNFFFKSGTSVGKTDFGKSWAKNHWSRKPLVSSPSLNNDDSPSCPVLGGAAIPPWRLLEGRPSTRKIKD